jgi:type I restriction enzyme S subunit
VNGTIPNTWLISTIGELSEYIQRGKSPKYAEKSSLPVINQKCIRWNLLELQHLKYIHLDQIPSWDEPRYIQNGDILWNSTGTGTVGRAYFVRKNDTTVPKVVDSHVTIVRPHNLIEKRLIYYWIKSSAVQQRIVEMCDGTTNQIELSRATISATEIPLAPINEQKRIADKLDTVLARVDACRERLNRVPLILKRFKQSVLAAATSGKLTVDWRVENVDISWANVKLEHVLREKPRNGYSPKAVDYETSIRSLTLSATTSGKFIGKHCKFIDESIPSTSHLWLNPGDILVQRANSLEYVGVSAIFDGPTNTFIYPDLMMKCRANERILTSYLFIVLSAESTRNYFRENATGTAGNMPKINQQTVASAPVQLPPIEEQQEIVRRVETLFAFADRLEARLTTARNATERLTPALLAKAFRGELVPQDSSDEPASLLLKRLAENRDIANNKPSRGPTPKKEVI